MGLGWLYTRQVEPLKTRTVRYTFTCLDDVYHDTAGHVHDGAPVLKRLFHVLVWF